MLELQLLSATSNVGDDDDVDATQFVSGVIDADDDTDKDDGRNTKGEAGGIDDKDEDDNVEGVEDGVNVEGLASECSWPRNSRLLIT